MLKKIKLKASENSRFLSYFVLVMIFILPVVKMNIINYYSGIIKIIITLLFYSIYSLFIFYAYKTYKFDFLINFLFSAITAFLPLIVLQNGFDTIVAPKAEYLYTVVAVMCILCIIKKLNIIHNYNNETGNSANKQVYVFIIIFFVLLLLSTINSISLKRSLPGRIFWNEGFFAISCYIILFLIASKYYRFSKLHSILLAASAAVISIIGIFQYYGCDLLGGKNGFEVYATIGQHDMVGTYTVMVLPIAVFSYLYCKKLYRYFYLIAASLIYLCMLCSFARSAWVGFGVMLVLSVYLVYKHDKKVLLRYLKVLLIFFIITIIFNLLSNNRMLDRADSINKDFNSLITRADNYKSAGSQRIYIWEKALGIIPYKPLLGSGPDTFDLQVKKVYGYFIYDGGIDRSTAGAIVTKAHNEYLQIAVTLGIPALICYIFFLFNVFRQGFISLRFNKLLIPLLCSITAYMIQAFFNNSVIGVAPLIWIFMGITCSRNVHEDCI